MKKLLLGIALIAVTLIVGLSVRPSVGIIEANHEESGNVCPDSDHEGWQKVDSNDLSTHPVDGATEYCYKDGDGFFFSDSPLDHTLNDDDEPVMEGRSKGLSHWSYEQVPVS